jgi:hypothetical protein
MTKLFYLLAAAAVLGAASPALADSTSVGAMSGAAYMVRPYDSPLVSYVAEETRGVDADEYAAQSAYYRQMPAPVYYRNDDLGHEADYRADDYMGSPSYSGPATAPRVYGYSASSW